MIRGIEWFDGQVDKFTKIRGDYVDFADRLEKILSKATHSMGISGAIIQARAKEIPSFAEKCIRKEKKYGDPVHQFTDLCGARVIVESKDQIGPVCDFIRKNFEIDEANSEDVIGRLRPGEFGYLSIHFVVSFKKEVDYAGVDEPIPPKFTERWEQLESRTSEEPRVAMPIGPIYKAEIQVRTLLQHAWANQVHDKLYKSDFKPTWRLERLAASIAEWLENADNSFDDLSKGVDFYHTYYGAYMSPESIREEIQVLEAVRKYNLENVAMAHKIARLALAVEDWQKAADVLRDLGTEDPALAVAILRDRGVALRKLQSPEGIELLKEAAKLSTQNLLNDVDTHCELGDALFFDLNQHMEARKHYETALRLAPSYPRALKNLILCKIIETRSLDFISLMRPSLQAAIETCSQWAAAEVYLPHAYFYMGFFHLILGEIYESLNTFAKALMVSTNESPIEESHRMMERLKEELHLKEDSVEVQYIEWIRRLLLVARVGKLIRWAEEAKEKAAVLKVASDKASQLLNEVESGRGSKDGPSPEDVRKSAAAARSTYDAAEEKATRAEERANRSICEYLANPGYKEACRYHLATRTGSPGEKLFDKDKQLVIVAGGCDASVEKQIGDYKRFVEFAFKNFEGTIVSGGTTAGISGLIGGLSPREGKIRKVAYLPEEPLPAGDEKHEDYEIYHIPEKGYTPLAPIQTWIDIVVSGIRPGAVRLLGINGGQLSAFEYRLGLVMGALVGVIRESGREATRISDDPNWKSAPGFILLPTDMETIRAFVEPSPSKLVMDPKDMEILARQAHENHSKKRRKDLTPSDPVLVDWEALEPHFRASNLEQVAHIEVKLARLGLKLRKVENIEAIKLFPWEASQLAILAEMEHGRWNVERLLDGWTLGLRDPAGKKTPYLLPWDGLEKEVKAWDFDAVQKLSETLKERGYEIYDPEEEA